MTAAASVHHEKSILILDADSENRQFLVETIENIGIFVIHEAETLDQAAHFCSTKTIDLVIVDSVLSRAERAKLVDAVHASAVRPALLWMTAPSLMSREEAYGLGADAVLSKPVDVALFRHTILEVLVPAAKRWKRAARAKGGRVVAGLVKNIKLGRGGLQLSLTPEDTLSALEGDELNLDISIDETQPWKLRGAGVVRYVNMDKKTHQPRSVGIEFLSVEDDSIEKLLERVNSQRSYIPQ